jgi:hypothetical protein
LRGGRSICNHQNCYILLVRYDGLWKVWMLPDMECFGGIEGIFAVE